MAVVIIPAYKPGKELIVIAEQLRTFQTEVVVVDDGSGAEYQQIFDSIKNICTILSHSENKGKGTAIKTALSFLQDKVQENDVIGVMDSDGQHLPEDMLMLLEFSTAHRKALALGVRKVGKDMPLKSRLGNQITRTVFRLISGVRVSDTQTGLRAFGAELIPELLLVEGERYEYEMNVLIAFAKAKIPIEEMPIHTIYQDRDNSGSHFRVFQDSFRIYKDIFKFTLSSLSSFAVDYCLFSALIFCLPKSAKTLLLANVLARVVSSYYNYSMNCRYVFHADQKISTAGKYFALAALILAANNLILETFVQRFFIPVYLAKLLTECLLFILSFLVQNFVIFKKKGGNS